SAQFSASWRMGRGSRCRPPSTIPRCSTRYGGISPVGASARGPDPAGLLESGLSSLGRTAMTDPIRLTQYSHGAGCGCKISPQVLDTILAGSGAQHLDPRLWVGNASKDDAAVYAIDEERGVVSTTDFFMPIVDDPYDFGRIAATNAIS